MKNIIAICDDSWERDALQQVRTCCMGSVNFLVNGVLVEGRGWLMFGFDSLFLVNLADTALVE